MKTIYVSLHLSWLDLSQFQLYVLCYWVTVFKYFQMLQKKTYKTSIFLENLFLEIYAILVIE